MLDPAIAAVVEQLKSQKALHDLTLEEMRSFMPPLPMEQRRPVASVRDTVTTGGVPVRLYQPTERRNDWLLVYFHGGGFSIGSIETHDNVARDLCETLGCTAMSVEYRLAPEHRFPAAPDDCLAAVRWAAENAAELGISPDHIVLAGDSAGGNLATVTCLRLRDEGGPKPLGQIMIYPVTDHYDPATQSYTDFATGYLLTRQAMIRFWDLYLNDASERHHPHAAPIRADDLSGLPPALVMTAGYDPLRDEGEAYAARLQEAGVPVKVIRYDGLIHGFTRMTTTISAATATLEDIRAWAETLPDGRTTRKDRPASMDEPTLALLEAVRNQPVPRYLLPIAESRAAMEGFVNLFSKGADVARRELFDIPVEGGSIELRLLVPNAAPRAVIVYIHGGGWVAGSNAVFEPMGRDMAVATGCAVAMVCYRKAPEHAYPGPLNDAWAGFNWVAERRGELFGSELPMVVGGDSAGANLATVVAMRDLATGAPRLVAQVLIYPVTDSDFETASYLDPESQLMLPRDAMMTYWNHYLPDEARRSEPEASPLRAPDLTGMPPTVLLTASTDVLRDEGEAYARRLREAGVPVAFREFEGQIHGFAMMVGLLPGAADAIAYIAEELDRILAR
ncbi:MAG: alpha/beta hydrolase [Amaricoccus sp.]|uniref:alpha/beta hydrolase n=1 Tax=Amaricoccus sp. TaxID=1872485 RepID=UPI0039E224E9